MGKNNHIAVFGGGCFWCTEAVFSAGGVLQRRIRRGRRSAFGGTIFNGVKSVTPGYAGGPELARLAFARAKRVGGRRPTYEEVCSGTTGYAEVVKIEFNPAQISFRDLLAVFFATHDPTTPDRQGGDVGTQYRSTILYTNAEQKREAETFIQELNDSNEKGAPIVTEVKPLTAFFEAEDYHKNYYAKNPKNSYCQVVINPKLEKVQKQFAKLLDK